MNDKPNILFILTDDLGWKDLSCYGSEFYESPHIDRLCAEGMRFTDAYAAAPICSPTRASILTGQYPARLKLTNYIDWGHQRHPLRGRIVDAPYIDRLPTDQVCIAHPLSEAGYATWHVGKWHLGYEDTYPDRHGFDINIGGCEWGMPCKGYFAPWNLPSLPGDDVPEGTYLDDYLTDRAIELIQSAGDRPFYLNLWYYLVHVPIQAKDEDIAYFEEKARKMGLDRQECFKNEGRYPYLPPNEPPEVMHRTIQSNAVYAAMIKALDDNVGRVLQALDACGKTDNTVVFFSSDNGGLNTGNHPPTCNAPLAYGKGWVQEGGTRVDTIVKAPGIVPPGSVCEEPTTSPDFYPTILELCGLDAMPEQHKDGVSILPLLRGETMKRRPIFWHYPHYSNCGGHPGCSVRDGDYILIEFFEDHHLELYNLKNDISQRRNLAEEQPERRDAMLKVLHDWRRAVGGILPTRNPDWSPDDCEAGCAPTV